MQKDLGVFGLLIFLVGSAIIAVLMIVSMVAVSKVVDITAHPWVVMGSAGLIFLYGWYRMLNIPCRYCTSDSSSSFLDYSGIWRN